MGVMCNGVKQWVFQRVVNALVVTFGIALFSVLIADGGLSYAALSEMFAKSSVKFYLTVVLVLACLNSVLAGWQIEGDYAKKFGIPANIITIVTLIVSAIFLFYGLTFIY